MKKIKSYFKRNSVELVISDENKLICSYNFHSKNASTELGQRLIFITLLRFAILDNLKVDKFELDQGLSKIESDYINNEIYNMIEYSKKYHEVDISHPQIKATKVKHKVINTYLDKGSCLIGFSGGKDSRLCLDVIKDSFNNIIKFKIDFDNEEFLNDYHESIKVLDQSEYIKTSTASIYKEMNKNYYQEEDLHCCFAAPYFSVDKNYPANLSIGLQFDVVNYHVYDKERKRISEYGLTETYNSVQIFNELMRSYGLKDFNLIVPLASATSFSIYNIIRKEYGDTILREMNSCWQPINNQPCGECMKCQRVSYIYDLIGMNLTEKEENSLKIFNESNKDLDYLFGSISCKNLLDEYVNERLGSQELINSLYMDDKIETIDFGFTRVLSEKYDMSIITNPFIVEHNYED